MMNLPEKLAREIGRVTALREQYAALDGMPQVNVKPAIFMIDNALENAKRAAGMEDAIAQRQAISDLEAFTG